MEAERVIAYTEPFGFGLNELTTVPVDAVTAAILGKEAPLTVVNWPPTYRGRPVCGGGQCPDIGVELRGE